MAEKMRKNVSWRVSENDHPKYKEINQWLNSQNKIQDTLNNIALHFIESFGMRDVQDFDIQKALFNLRHADLNVHEPEQPVITNHSSSEEADSTIEPEPEEDDLYKDVDQKNF